MKRHWSIYIMLGNLKIYLRKSITTTEAVNWLQAKCKHNNSNYFMHGTQVFCESK